MAYSHQPSVNAKAAAVLLSCSSVVVFFVCCLGHGDASELVPDDVESLHCQIVARAVFPEIIIAEEDPSVAYDIPVILGGISDVTVEKAIDDNGQFVIRLLTDRGPSRKIETARGKQRVFLNQHKTVVFN